MQSETMDKKELEAMAKQMAKGVKTEADLASVTRTMMKTLIETALKAELTDHLGYEQGDPDGVFTGNSRNGTTPKTVVSDSGPLADVESLQELDERFPGVSAILEIWFSSYKGPGRMEVTGIGDRDEARTRLEGMRDFYCWYARELPALHQRWEEEQRT